MDLQTASKYLPGRTLLPSTSEEMLSNNADEDSESDIESDDEEAEEEVGSSDSDSSTGDSVNCPICLLKFKGQAIGFPEVCGHPFCLDCILEWSKNVQTCPNDRRKFENILVRLDLEGEVVRKIPVSAPSKGEEDDGAQDITECQICRLGNREDVLLLCDRCDQGYHMDCLDPPIDEVPIEDWFCPQCLGTQPSTTPARRRAPLALRVRRTIQRSRQRILRESSVTRRTKKTKTKKKRTTKRRKTTKTAGSRRKRKTKAKSRKNKKLAVPSPRKRLADALGLGEKNSVTAEPGSHFSLFGNPNDLDSVQEEEHDVLSAITRPKNEPKSLIAKLAERRKAGKSIFSFGPVATVASPTKPAKPVPVVSSGNPDLLGSILASQSQLSSFGKTSEVLSRPKPKTNNSSRVLGAILASQATLSLLDGVAKNATEDSPPKVQRIPQSMGSQTGKRCAGQQNHSESAPQAENSSQGSASSQSTCQPRTNGHAPAGRGSNGGCSGGDDGEDPNKNRRKRPEPKDKSDETEEDVDLYSDIESIDGDPEQQARAKVPDTPVDDKNSEEDDEKGLVIDDSNAEDPADGKTPDARSEPTEETKQEVERPKEEAAAEKTAVPTAAQCKFQHDGLPAAAAALSYGPKGASRPQPRPRSTSSAGPVIDDVVKASLVSTIASALKESLASALLAHTQSDALVDQEEDIPLPAPTYSESKTCDSPEPVVPKEPTLDLKFDVPAIKRDEEIKLGLAAIKSEAKPSRKRRMEEIFGSDDDEPKNQADQLEQISDCEEGELDESEGEGVAERQLPPSGNRIVRMLTPPPTSTSEKHRSNKNGDCEEGEIVDKKQAKQKNVKKKKLDEVTVSVDDEILREAGIGGERRVEMCIEDEGIPSTFKKLDSGKTRYYRHQGEIKVIEGKTEVKVKKEQETDEKQRSKRQEMKRYDVRRVVEQRTGSKGDGSHRSRSESKSRSAKKSKSHRKRSSSSSSTSSSSSSSSMSSLSPERSRKDRYSRKRSRSSSSERHGKRKSKVRSRDRSDEKHRDKKKKSKKKKKVKAKHKERKISTDGKERAGHSEADPEGDDIEIPSKAVFASGDKIVVSLHFGSSGTSKQPPKKSKKRKSESRERPSKKGKEDEHSSKKSASKTVKTEVKEAKLEPTKESSSKVERLSPEPKQEISKPDAKAKSSDQRRNGEKSESSSKRPEPADNRAAARPRPRPPHPRHRGKPVLIDIETSREIPLEDNRPSDVIVLSDSDTEAHMALIDSASIPLPPTPPPPLPSELPPEPPKPEPPKNLPEVKASETKPPEPPKNHQPPKQQPAVLPPSRPLIAPRNRGSKGGLLLKQGAGVKFSLSSKANSLKKVNNPLFQAAEEDEDEEEAQSSEQATAANPTEAASPSKSTTKADGSKENESAEDPSKPSDTQPKRTSPIFRPSTPPLPASTSYDPSHPTRTPSSGASTPSLPLSPKPRQAPPPLPPLPTPPVLSTFPLPHPGAVLIPPMTSLPPPPLPPPPLMTPSFVRAPGQLLPGVYNTSIPPPVILPMHPTVGPPPSTATKPPSTPTKPPSTPTKPSSQAPVSTPSKTGRPTTPTKTGRSATPSKTGRPTTPSKTGRPMTPPSPTPSEGSDIFGPPSASPDSPMSDRDERPQVSSTSKSRAPPPASSGTSNFDSLFQSGSSQKGQTSHRPGPSASASSSSKHHGSSSSHRTAAPKDKSSTPSGPSSASLALALAQDGEELPSSAVELQVKEKFLKKLNRQERVVEEVRLALKPYYTTKKISKGDYKEILRKCVPKICHTKSGEINPIKIKEMVKGYVKKFRYQHKKDVAQ